MWLEREETAARRCASATIAEASGEWHQRRDVCMYCMLYKCYINRHTGLYYFYNKKA